MPAYLLKALTYENEVGIVGHEAAGRTEVDDVACGWSGLGERANVRHNIMAELLLQFSGPIKIDIVQVCPQSI